MSQSYNLGLIFYRSYYDGWDFANNQPFNGRGRNKEEKEKNFFDARSKQLAAQRLPADTLRYPNQLDKTTILKTTYPGLLLGSGYAHGIGKVQGEHKIGFYFDHTTGLPVIPGSSVKGALRNAFPGRYHQLAADFRKKGKTEDADAQEELAEGRYAYVAYLLEEKINMPPEQISRSYIDRLEAEIFAGCYDLSNDGMIPMSQRDIFHDAFPTMPNDKALLGNDFITPHLNRNKQKDGIPDELKNPVPIQFLKVLPEVSYQFQFRLLDDYSITSEQEIKVEKRLLNAAQRRLLFQSILLDMGVGAKTNVGYGQFIDPTAPPVVENNSAPTAKVESKRETKPATAPSKASPPATAAFDPDKHLLKSQQLRRGKQVLAKIIDIVDKEINVQLHVSDWDKVLTVKYLFNPKPKVGEWCWVIIKTAEGKAPNWNKILLETNKVTPI